MNKMKQLIKNELEELISELLEAIKSEVRFCKDNKLKVSARSVMLIDRCKVLEVGENWPKSKIRNQELQDNINLMRGPEDEQDGID